VRAAAEQAQAIIEQLEAGNTNLPMETKLLKTWQKIRSDLWQQAEEMKHHANFPQAQDQVAQWEVQLVWAGHEHHQLGWRKARPFVQAAERLAREVQAKMAGETGPGPGSRPSGRIGQFLGLVLPPPPPAGPAARTTNP
jgi:hypothetical protein